MQIVPILFIVLAAAALLGGFLVLIGTERAQKALAVLYFLFATAFAGWSALYVNSKVQTYGFYFAIAFFVLAVVLCIWLAIMLKRDKRFRASKGIKMSIIALLVFGVLGAVIMFILPLAGIHIEWVALFGTAPIFLVIYFSTLRYRMLLLSNRTLKLWSYIIMATAAIFAYMLLFYVISKYLFRIETSAEVIAMNLVMVLIVIIIFPVLNELNAEINSLISTQKVNLTYVIRKLNNLATQNVKYDKLAEFLAEHLHFRYIGIIVNEKVYGTRPVKLSNEEILELGGLEADKSKNGIWRKIAGRSKEKLEQLEVVAVAELRDAKGRAFGQMLIGNPLGKISFEKRDLAELEMIINLVASIVDSREKLNGWK